jgi:hypothetical protein
MPILIGDGISFFEGLDKDVACTLSRRRHTTAAWWRFATSGGSRDRGSVRFDHTGPLPRFEKACDAGCASSGSMRSFRDHLIFDRGFDPSLSRPRTRDIVSSIREPWIALRPAGQPSSSETRSSGRRLAPVTGLSVRRAATSLCRWPAAQ